MSHAEADFVIALAKPEIDWEVIQKNMPSLKTVIPLGADFERLFQLGGEFKPQACPDG